MVKLDEVLDHLRESKDLQNLIIGQADVIARKCDNKSNVIFEHHDCFELAATQNQQQSSTTPCHRALLILVLKCIATKQSVVDDEVKKRLSSQFKDHNLKAEGLLNQDVLNLLNNGSDSQILIWIKYESLLTHLIQEHIYEPKTMLDEVLTLMKNELHPNLAAKLSPVLSTCAQICRKVSTEQTPDDNLEEKWSEIIDWIGWFISGNDNDLEGP